MSEHPTPSPTARDRIVFLGAGFSKAAGLPLANELLDLVLVEIHRHFPGETKLDKSVVRYREFLKATTGEDGPIDIEEFGAYLDHAHILGLRGNDTWSEEGNEDQLMLRWGIGAVLHHATPAAADLPDVYHRFAAWLRPGDCVVTFNYDRIVESVLEAAGTPYRRFPSRWLDFEDDSDDSEILILKLHGSLDWVDRRVFDAGVAKQQDPAVRGYQLRHNLVFGSRPSIATHKLLEAGPSRDDALGTIQVVEDLDAYYGNLNLSFHAPPLVLAPSPAKLLYGLPLRLLWGGLTLFPGVWGGLVVIGCSLPPGDPYTLQVLYELATGYAHSLDHPNPSWGPQQRIKLIDKQVPGEAMDGFLDRYQFLDPEHTDMYLDGFDETSLAGLSR